nr:PREDICTED: testican-1 [Anolis carolinensis]|eukprot:XP_016852701.1 PREDICTED: testican-1 [Anolis carolinensis]
MHANSICGSDGHSYTTKCKLDFHACTSGKNIVARCEGPCPCLPGQESPKHKTEKTELYNTIRGNSVNYRMALEEGRLAISKEYSLENACTDKELRNLASRLKDWFGALHEDANRVIKPTSSDSAQGRFDTSILPICKDSLGWMFNKLDMNYDLLLDHSEINAIYLDKYEPCIKPLFNSCDSFKDGKLSNNEWCYCFQKPAGLPCQNEMNRIQKLGKGKSLMGTFIPRCNEEGYYKATQCHGSTGQCWCVDKYGNEIAGSRKQGTVSCEEEQETSGDFGSGGSVILLDDLEEEHETTKKDKEGKQKIHVRAANDDDEDEDDDKDDEIGYIW